MSKIKTLEEYLELYKKYHLDKHNFELNGKIIGKGITPGELKGFKDFYKILMILKEQECQNQN